MSLNKWRKVNETVRSVPPDLGPSHAMATMVRRPFHNGVPQRRARRFEGHLLRKFRFDVIFLVRPPNPSGSKVSVDLPGRTQVKGTVFATKICSFFGHVIPALGETNQVRPAFRPFPFAASAAETHFA